MGAIVESLTVRTKMYDHLTVGELRSLLLDYDDHDYVEVTGKTVGIEIFVDKVSGRVCIG